MEHPSLRATQSVRMADLTPESLTPAAQYLRASTGLQTYSLESQAECIANFARARGYEVIATYSDGDRSGLDLIGRPGLQQLLAQALSPSPGFKTILVFDVSRWGRFQDLDQGAHYEFLCRQAGIAVEYCAEPFDNDGSPEADLIKQIKRSIAAEYSRELSSRITHAKRRIAAKGFLHGGCAPFGFRRLVVDRTGRRVAVLRAGERKIAAGHRTRLALGPAAEVATVRRIFQLYVLTGLKPAAIAALLDSERAPAPGRGGWTTVTVTGVLRREAYAGVHVHGRSSCRLRRRRKTPKAAWLRVVGAWPAIVTPARFAAAQDLLARRYRRSEDILLAELRALLAERGRIDTGLIDACPGMASAGAYIRRFGSLKRAYALIGYEPQRRAQGLRRIGR